MSAFTVSLSNPDIKGGQPNTAYTDKPGGNRLDIVIGNDSGKDRTFGPNSKDQSIAMTVDAKYMDATGAQSLIKGGAAAPWTIATDFSQTSTDYTFSLVPPSSGVPIANKDTITIHLNDFQPSAKGSTNLKFVYHFTSSDSVNTSPPLITQGMPAGYPHQLVGLAGSGAALSLQVFVNDVREGPIITSPDPTTDTNKIENKIHFKLLYQAASGAGNATSGLVSQWDTSRPPTFRIFFPYVDPVIDPHLDYCLTDFLPKGDAHYNQYTSAINIQASFDAQDPANPKSKYWGLPSTGGDYSDTNRPAWEFQPTGANTYVFTTEIPPISSPGPELNLYLLDIYSNLPLDQCPETLLYFQWRDFPGYDDGVWVIPLDKELLTISSFNAGILREVTGPCISFEWEGAGSTFAINGEDTGKGPSASYKLPLTFDQPLQSTYTLTACASNGVTTISQTLSIAWAINKGSFIRNFLSPRNLCTTVDYVVVSDRTTDRSGNAKAFFLDLMTLASSDVTPIAPNGGIVWDVVASPNGTTILVLGDQNLYAYTIRSGKVTPFPASGVGIPHQNYTGCNVCFTPDGSGIVLCTCPGNGTGTLHFFDANNLNQTGTRAIDPDTVVMAISPWGHYYLATPDTLSVMDAKFNPVQGSPLKLPNIGQIVCWSDSKDQTRKIFILSGGGGNSGILSRLDPATLKVEQQISVAVQGALFMDNPHVEMQVSPLQISPDGTLLFLAGVNGSLYAHKMTIAPIFLVFDADTLQPPAWTAKIQADASGMIVDMAFAVTGDRLYTAGYAGNTDPGRKALLYTVDAYFP